MRHPVDHDGLLRRGLTDCQDVVREGGLARLALAVGILLSIVGIVRFLVDVHTPLALADVTMAVPPTLISALASLVGSSGVAAIAVTNGRRFLVGTTGAGHRGRLRVVVGFLLVEGEGLLQVSDAHIEGRVHPAVPRKNREIVVAHGPDQEGLAQRHRSGIVGLEAQSTRRGGGDVVRTVFSSSCVGLASNDVGPVVPTLSHGCFQPRLDLRAAGVLDRRLVRVARVVARLAAHDAEVAVVGHEGCAISFSVVDDGGADTSLGAIKRGRGHARRFERRLGARRLNGGRQRG